MAVIDSDTHIVEGYETFEYLTKAERDFVQRVTIHHDSGEDSEGLVVDGLLRPGGASDEKAMSTGLRDLTDIEGRLARMDELGTDVQVIYPTIFLRPPTDDPAVELALSRAYNRYLAERSEATKGRIIWTVVPPLMSMDAAVEEAKFGAEHGARGVFFRGFEHGMLPSDPYFTPLLQTMNDLHLALCIHAGNGTSELIRSFERLSPANTGIWRSKLPGVTAFHAILGSDLSVKYPNIRFGFIELAASWIPYVLSDHVLRVTPSGRASLRERDAFKQIDIASLMPEHRFYVSCQTNDDLPYLLKFAGPDNLLAATDFGHADTSSELLALQRIRDTPGVAVEALDNILDANPRAFYEL